MISALRILAVRPCRGRVNGALAETLLLRRLRRVQQAQWAQRVLQLRQAQRVLQLRRAQRVLRVLRVRQLR